MKVYCRELPEPLHCLDSVTDEQVLVIFVQVPVYTMLASVALTVTFVLEEGGFVAVGTGEEEDKIGDGANVRVEVEVEAEVEVEM